MTTNLTLKALLYCRPVLFWQLLMRPMRSSAACWAVGRSRSALWIKSIRQPRWQSVSRCALCLLRSGTWRRFYNIQRRPSLHPVIHLIQGCPCDYCICLLLDHYVYKTYSWSFKNKAFDLIITKISFAVFTTLCSLEVDVSLAYDITCLFCLRAEIVVMCQIWPEGHKFETCDFMN